MRDRLNWPLVLITTIVGLGAIGAGLWLEDFDEHVWSSVLVQVGAAIGLLSMLVLLERRVVTRVAERTAQAVETTARAEVARMTTDLRERVQRIEDLDAAQEEERANRRRRADEQIDRIRGGDISRSTVGELLLEAVRDRLIDQFDFKVRTSSDAQSPTLYMLPFVDPSRVVAIYMDFEPFELAIEPIVVDGEPIRVPRRTDSGVMWLDESPASIGADLLAGLERRNTPTDAFGFGYALTMLTKSVETVRAARAAPAGSPARLEGELRTLINDDWAYTTSGLESLSSAIVFEETTHVDPRRFGNMHRFIQVPKPVEDSADTSLAEALAWLQAREGVGTMEKIDRRPGSPF